MKYTLHDLIQARGVSEPLREAVVALMAKLEAAEKERDELRTELKEIRYGVAVAHDTIKALRAKIEAMEKQEPVGVVQWIKGWPVVNAHDGVILEPNKPLYALPGAQPAQSVPDAVMAALENLDDYIARIEGNDRGACGLINLVRRYLLDAAEVGGNK